MMVSRKLHACLLTLTLLTFATVSSAQVARSAPDLVPNGKGWGESVEHSSAGKARPSKGNGITYHGGPVILGTVNVYYIWYGNWAGNSAETILTNLAQSIGGSSYFNINTTYYQGSTSKQNVSNSVN